MAQRASAAAVPGFNSLGLDDRLVEALGALGYEEPTPIQREAIPPLLEKKDLIGQAATGTGKTAAFALPLLHLLAGREGKGGGPFALVLVPTRELAMQVAEAVHKYGRALRASVLPIYGGQAYGPQLRALQRGADVVIATPGRALDLAKGGKLKLDSVEVVVLDEADEMLDMGFAEDIEAILHETPAERQTVLFSATLPPRIAAIARRHLTDPVKIKIAAEQAVAGTTAKVRQTAYIVPRGHKLATLARVLDVENPTSAIVFCRRRNEVDELAESLSVRGYRVEALHGGMTQDQRTRVMKKFRGEASDLLIATDVAARGLDIQHLSHVINYDVPAEPESYVHRIGRVGRAGREGVAITLAEPREHRQLRSLEHATGQKIEIAKVPTIADMRARRLELTRASIREAIVAGELDRYRVVVETLAGEFDVVDVAMAAVKLLHQSDSNGEQDADEIPDVEIWDRPRRDDRPRPGNPRDGRGRPARGGGEGRGDMSKIYVGAGRAAGIRPQDLVGAITNEAGLTGGQVGGIDIADRFSLVEVPEDLVESVIAALRSTKLKGRKVTVRRDRAAE
ncbi:DEAD-box ATP-dependent RNA helicase CshA [Aquisphaera giovannonii]|uniref:DEAD-box ATP-dependent RNA helicase CshA n=1 Tax=Aquisphaera giovannonii TaxID=406548 RepID=A0A5B9VZY0_9BACT|nr:DEAD/DEAH box helicase [Aquisphaera giovannonii]QEH33549.1 DEAD-box ATP-dependent RNA helicase CshA [Aquisphaera giovannonii]